MDWGGWRVETYEFLNRAAGVSCSAMCGVLCREIVTNPARAADPFAWMTALLLVWAAMELLGRQRTYERDADDE